MARTRKPTFMDTYMAEKISLGGALVTRAAAVRQMEKAGHDRRCIDCFVFRPDAIPEEAQAPYQAICPCGAQWLSMLPLSLEGCDHCTEEAED